jgi:hypothetical protein
MIYIGPPVHHVEGFRTPLGSIVGSLRSSRYIYVAVHLFYADFSLLSSFLAVPTFFTHPLLSNVKNK